MSKKKKNDIDSDDNYLTRKFNYYAGNTRWDKAPRKSGQFTWEAFIKNVRDRSNSDVAIDIAAMPDGAEQQKIKQSRGWYVFGEHDADHPRSTRRAKNRSGITIDIDKGSADIPEIIKGIEVLRGKAWLIHQTATSSVDQPKYRLIIPLAETLALEEYEAAVTLLMKWIGYEAIDYDASKSMHQLMYLPVWGRQEYVGDRVIVNEPGKVERGSGTEFLDVLMLLDTMWEHEYGGDWRSAVTWPEALRERIQVERKSVAQREAREKYGDLAEQAAPLLKENVVGDFCRAYSIPAAMDKFLGDIWFTESALTRYTWWHRDSSGGKDAPGGQVYCQDGSRPGMKGASDEGVFFYSHHANSDPYSHETLNAFDLVRLHLYGALDKEKRAGTKEINLPSFKAMKELIDGDESVRLMKLNRSSHGFGKVDVSERKGKGDSKSQKEVDREGDAEISRRISEHCLIKGDFLVCDRGNCDNFLEYVMRITEYIGYNSLTTQTVIYKNYSVTLSEYRFDFTCEDDFQGSPLEEHHYKKLIAMMSLMSDVWHSRNFDKHIKNSVLGVAQENTVNPLREYYERKEHGDKEKYEEICQIFIQQHQRG